MENIQRKSLVKHNHVEERGKRWRQLWKDKIVNDIKWKSPIGRMPNNTVNHLLNVVDRFVKTGRGYSGRIMLTEFCVIITLVLSKNPRIPCIFNVQKFKPFIIKNKK